MKKLENHIKAIMTGETDTGLAASCLYGFSCVYSNIMKIRETLYQRGISRTVKLPCPVISVGNITTGGTGKTPMILYMAGLLRDLGMKPAIVSRGYGGKAEKTGGIVCDGQHIRMNADQAGDEPLMLAKNLKNVPVLAGQNRTASGFRAIRELGADVILLDDGFQHMKLARDVNIVLLHSNAPFGNGHLIPRGMLREPLSALNRADAFVLTRWDDGYRIPELPPGRPVFRAVHQPCIRAVIPAERNIVENLDGQPIFVFSGIAQNADFLKTAAVLGGKIAGFSGFSDHHFYSDADLEGIFRAAKKAGAKLLATTEKDFARMRPDISWPMPLAVIGVDIAFCGDDEKQFEVFIREHLTR